MGRQQKDGIERWAPILATVFTGAVFGPFLLMYLFPVAASRLVTFDGEVEQAGLAEGTLWVLEDIQRGEDGDYRVDRISLVDADQGTLRQPVTLARHMPFLGQAGKALFFWKDKEGLVARDVHTGEQVPTALSGQGRSQGAYDFEPGEGVVFTREDGTKVFLDAGTLQLGERGAKARVTDSSTTVSSTRLDATRGVRFSGHPRARLTLTSQPDPLQREEVREMDGDFLLPGFLVDQASGEAMSCGGRLVVLHHTRLDDGNRGVGARLTPLDADLVPGWTAPLGGGRIHYATCRGSRLILVVSGVELGTGRIQALDASTGAIAWEHPLPT